ncbi:vesicle transport V-SNARE protein amine-terminal protein (macronuclear) [Tetrahymena thermophila SB210]|uniref:Vesicle transport V-SNARE protein amine-terminal protein n=1 Tax=Tetrahymena thermophila (strain SB210) TaxID=312017 RepID=Q235Y3_TETTS|nr:vesicle transport V-SNARE protein amine-terminal protein [Tetrahymena thermophila SB210]EAR92617.3 vesicle transport V-SNARE protein amine-terminal protein [Tetrahymena thermophila SB210]|eukprot:XP_001012862.3 vesicle transport V-SNARE protein amine-terminal protein [Tetrahymena thermophila SB210]
MADQAPLEISELFISYEEDFQNIIQTLNQRYKQFKNNQLDFKEDLQNVKNSIKEAENCVKQMEFEINCLPNSIKKNYTTIVSKYRQDYDDVFKKYSQLQVEKSIYQNNTERSILIQQGNNICEQGQMLNDIEQLAGETEQIVDEVSTRLLGDRQVIKKNIDKSKDIQDELRKADLVMSVMNRTIVVNRTVIYFIIIILFVLNLLVLYLKL